MTVSLRLSLAGLLVVLVVAGLAFMPATTRQGIDAEVSTISLPLYLKALEFVDRDADVYFYLSSGDAINKISYSADASTGKLFENIEWTIAQISLRMTDGKTGKLLYNRLLSIKNPTEADLVNYFTDALFAEQVKEFPAAEIGQSAGDLFFIFIGVGRHLSINGSNFFMPL